MRIHSFLIFVVFVLVGALGSCAKYKDPKGVVDPRLSQRHYCNDPDAVNYNWGFPGEPDNTLCFYPTDVFAGKYVYYDSVFIKKGFYYIAADTYTLTINRISSTKMVIYGLCTNGTGLSLTALPSFVANVDTTVGDTLTSYGQPLCSLKDTINGTIAQNRIDSTLTINFEVASDTGVTTLHVGTAKPIR